MFLLRNCGGSVEQIKKGIQKLEALTAESTFVNKSDEMQNNYPFMSHWTVWI